jgi:protein-S-isoprenylcysteine O-methyltransferase Ste14
LWVIGTFVYIVRPELMGWSRLPLPPWSRWLGVLITAAGMALEFSTQIYLGSNYASTVHIREEHSLITGGPYRHVRHPMYTALITVGIGLGLASASWYFLLPFLLTTVIVVIRIPSEEAAMIERFGDEYRQYTQRTGRLLPRLRQPKPTIVGEGTGKNDL